MKTLKIFFLVLLLLSERTYAQDTTLIYNKRFIDAEDKWVALPQYEKDTAIIYAFIYIDEAAGLSFHYGGTFKIKNGTFIPNLHSDSFSLKRRIEAGNNALIAIIPDEKLIELRLNKIPEWLHFYKTDSPSLRRLVRWGYYYNDYGASSKALSVLESAYKKEPHFEGLEFELGFAYNVTEQYNKAINILKSALKYKPDECLFYKELAYAYLHLNDLTASEDVYNNAVTNCSDKKQNVEAAYNLAHNYFLRKNKERTSYWITETKKWAEPDSRIMKKILIIEQKNN